ncbi:MAG: hypothetical protein LBR36_01680 [Bacteroidales bacterium]|jgi:hypothetical protein|nr:hypothetical protein [Bacteroidales bacterium]
MTKTTILRNTVKTVAVLAAVTVMTACNSGGGSKQQNSNASETKTEVKASASAALEASDDAKTMLAKYGLTAAAIAPQNAFYTFLSFGQQQEVVGFLQTKGTKKDLKRDFTKMLEGIKAASDDGKIYNALTTDLEFDMTTVTDYALAHTFQYISKGEHRVVYLAYDSGFTKPGTNDRYPQYRITFNYEQPKFN